MIAKLKPYPAMKDSGAPWLRAVPEHWEILPLCAIGRPRQLTNQQQRELLSVYLGRGVVPFSSVDEKRTNPTSEDLSKYQAVEPGDFVLNNQQAWRGSVGVSRYQGIVSPAYLVLALDGRLDREFADRLLSGREMVAQYLVSSKGVGTIQRNLYWPHLRRAAVPIPPSAEQAAIVGFLDYADRRIRRYIRAKQKLIQLLAEQKQTLIHRAVTRGLNPNVRLKPSGVEWLGDVPEHWKVVPLKRIGSVRIGLTYSPGDVCGESGTLVLRASNVRNGQLVHADDVHVSREVPRHLRVRENDILVCVRSGSRNLVGKAALITKAFEGVSYGAFMSLLRTIDNRFYYRVLNSNLLPTVMAQFETSTINQLTQNDLRCLVVPVPPDAERAAITTFLDSKTANVDATIAAAAEAIKLLREFRTRLIADVVTGKLDVREAAARLTDEVEDPAPLDETEVESDAEDTDGVPEEAEA